MRFSRLATPVLIFLLSISVAAPAMSAGPSGFVSYNTGPASRYHAPISGMGIMALSKTFRGQYSSNQVAGASSPTTSTQNVPPGLTWFINDTSYAPQSETSVAVDPSNSSHVLGGYNDGRWFFCPLLRASECPSGYSDSVTGFTTSTNGGVSVAKSNDLPGVITTELNLSSGKSSQHLVYSWGDPAVAPAPNRNFYFATLAIDPVTGASGVMIQVSNANLWNPSVSCISRLTAPAVNSCWTAHIVFGNFSYQCPVAHLCGTTTLEDKTMIAVDSDPSSPNNGDAYVTWNHFYASGQSAAFAAVCNPTLSCTMISGGGAPTASGTDKFAGNATPAVASDGTVYLSWCNFGTATAFGPVYCSVKSSPAGGGSFGTLHSIMSFMGAGTQLPGDTVIVGFATEQFRTSSVPTFVTGSGGDLYYAVSLCTSGFYYRFPNDTLLPSDNPGNCGVSGIFFTRSTNNGVDWSTPTQESATSMIIQPTLTYDSKTGALVLAYYTAQYDSLRHRVDVVAVVSKDQGQTFASQIRATSVSNEPNSDPSMYSYIAPNGFGGSFVVPQYGDYFAAWAYGGKVWILFTGNYAQAQGTFKASPFLAVVGEAPSSLVFSPNSRGAYPGASVRYTASGFTGGSKLSLTLNWNGIYIGLANTTVSGAGLASGNFTVPNVQSQVYQVVAKDSSGLTTTASLGVGQVSLSPIQASINSLQNSVSSLQGAVSSLSTSVSDRFASLNTTVTNARSGLASSISAIASDISGSVSGPSSKLSIVEYLAVAVLVLLVVVIALVARKGGGQPRGSSGPPGFA